jgi:hypothetical protein
LSEYQITLILYYNYQKNMTSIKYYGSDADLQ